MRISRLVIDTNVFVSGLIFAGSVPGRVIDRAIAVGTLVATHSTLDELIAILLGPRLDRVASRSTRQATLDRLLPMLDIVEPIRIIRACRDPKDDKFLEAAINGDADAIVTGDKDLLVLHPFGGVDILTPADYLARLADRE
jgi:putative PIN family toxin of toxin-antitoxin system